MSLRTSECKECKKQYRILTEEDLCTFCSQKINKEWPTEFEGGEMTLHHMSL